MGGVPTRVVGSVEFRAQRVASRVGHLSAESGPD